MSAWRPIQALETRALSASAATSRYSSGETFREMRCFEGMTSQHRCVIKAHSAALRGTLAQTCRDVN